MNLPDNRPSNVNFDELTGLSYQDDASNPRLHYQGRSVQTLRSSCPPYFIPSAPDHNEAHSVSPLTGFHITSLTQSASNGFNVSDIPNTPESSTYQHVPENYVASVDDELPVISSSHHCVQPCFSAIEPDIRKPTLANRLNSHHHLTNLPAELANPQDSQPVAVANPLNLEQAASDNPVNSTKIVADKSSQAERRRERRRELQRQRYRNNPVVAERQREYQRELRKNPAYLKLERERQRKRHKERCQTDPAYVERRRARNRRRYQTDPAYAERRRAQTRRRNQTDPSYVERKNRLARERREQDPVFAEGQNIYIRVYCRMKKRVGKKEASTLAATARKEYLQSVNCPEVSGDLTRTSHSAVTRKNTNKNSDAPGNEPDIKEPALLPSSISESSDCAQATGAAGNFFTSPPKQMPITTVDCKERYQDEASEVSVEPGKVDNGNDSEIKIVRVWSMTIEEGSHFFNNSHQHINIQTSPIIQADNLGNEFVHRCVTPKNAMTGHQHKGPYKCGDCDKGFAKKSNLKVHQRSHAGEKPYECQQCNRSFAQRSNFIAHRHTHRAEMAEATPF